MPSPIKTASDLMVKDIPAHHFGDRLDRIESILRLMIGDIADMEGTNEPGTPAVTDAAPPAAPPGAGPAHE